MLTACFWDFDSIHVLLCGLASVECSSSVKWDLPEEEHLLWLNRSGILRPCLLWLLIIWSRLPSLWVPPGAVGTFTGECKGLHVLPGFQAQSYQVFGWYRIIPAVLQMREQMPREAEWWSQCQTFLISIRERIGTQVSQLPIPGLSLPSTWLGIQRLPTGLRAAS